MSRSSSDRSSFDRLSAASRPGETETRGWDAVGDVLERVVGQLGSALGLAAEHAHPPKLIPVRVEQRHQRLRRP